MLMLGMLISGTANTIVVKAMDVFKSNGDSFAHPYFQCASMFFGEFSVLGVYFIMKWRQRRAAGDALMESGDNKPKFNALIFAIPAFFDTCSSTLNFVALVLTTASIYQMIRGLIVVITALFSVTILKRKLFRHHWLGVILVFLGVFVVGLSSIIFPQKSSDAPQPDVGLILLLIS